MWGGGGGGGEGGYSFDLSVLNTHFTITLLDNFSSREDIIYFLSTPNMLTLVKTCITRQ